MKKSIKVILWIYILLFALLIGYLVKVAFFDSRNYATNSYNPRMSYSDNTIKRGAILDRSGKVIAESIRAEGEEVYQRKYYYPEAFCHIVGYDVKGMAGLEAKYSFQMETVEWELLQRVARLIGNSQIYGNDLVLTMDADLQEFCYERLGRARGAVVVSEVKTGKVLSMVSYPNYSSQSVEENWISLSGDNENSPLLNRASQGLYPPGSVFKIVTAASALETKPQLQYFPFECDGEEYFGYNRIRCFNSTKHGSEEMRRAFALSCNTYFATIGTEIGTAGLRSGAEAFMLNKELGFELPYSKSSFELMDDASQSEIIETAIGQGKTLVSPLHINMITAAIANKGVMMKPYVLDHFENHFDKVRGQILPSPLAVVATEKAATEVGLMMQEVVSSGTATDAQVSPGGGDIVASDGAVSGTAVEYSRAADIVVAGKTGTAENSSGKDHAWFTAYAPADNPQIAVTVLLENAGKGSKAIPTAREIIRFYLEREV